MLKFSGAVFTVLLAHECVCGDFHYLVNEKARRSTREGIILSSNPTQTGEESEIYVLPDVLYGSSLGVLPSFGTLGTLQQFAKLSHQWHVIHIFHNTEPENL